ncbi:MAG: multiubiquitin domain-containing protein [Candidatus Delongbacteria bacterium]|jgi:hypothetical protein|nr:multiubiquitin domain-containing protein [Candidatus Delongbacteria bacterium]
MQEQEKENHGQDKIYTIIVNGREKQWEGKVITFKEVVILAFEVFNPDPRVTYTVTYTRGTGNKPEGIMDQDDEVKIKEGMIFNVTATDKS